MWLMQDLDYFDHIPYASSIAFELKYSPVCLEEGLGIDCIGVSIRYNGENMDLRKQGLCTGDRFHYTHSGCTWREFNNMIAKLWYNGPHKESLDKACLYDPRGTLYK